jgi:hypothetical protein
MAAKKVSKKTPSVTAKTTRKRAKAKKKVARKIESPPKEVGLHANAEMLHGSYCNVAQIKHTPREFVLDFIMGVDNHHSLVSRVLTSPGHAKEIADALMLNIAQYENKFGEIEVRKNSQRKTH